MRTDFCYRGQSGCDTERLGLRLFDPTATSVPLIQLLAIRSRSPNMHFQALAGRSTAAVWTGGREAEQSHQLIVHCAALIAAAGFDSGCCSGFEHVRRLFQVALEIWISDTSLDRRKVDVVAARAGRDRSKTTQKTTQHRSDDDG